MCRLSRPAYIAHSFAFLIVDSTFATPFLLRPIEYARTFVHSAPNSSAARNRRSGGVIVDAGKFDWANGKYPGLSAPNPS